MKTTLDIFQIKYLWKFQFKAIFVEKGEVKISVIAAGERIGLKLCEFSLVYNQNTVNEILCLKKFVMCRPTKPQKVSLLLVIYSQSLRPIFSPAAMILSEVLWACQVCLSVSNSYMQECGVSRNTLQLTIDIMSMED